MKKTIILSSLFAGLIVICVLIALAVENVNRTPYEYLQSRNNVSSGPVESINELLCYEDIGNNEYIIFFINKNNNISCTILRKTPFSYKTIAISGELELTELEDFPGQLFYSAYNNKRNYFVKAPTNWVCWAVVRDDVTLYVDGVEAQEVELNQHSFNIAFALGDGVLQDLPEHEFSR